MTHDLARATQFIPSRHILSMHPLVLLTSLLIKSKCNKLYDILIITMIGDQTDKVRSVHEILEPIKQSFSKNNSQT